MKVLITGATGLVGSEIVKRCAEDNISVNFLTTSAEKVDYFENAKGFVWSPSEGKIDLNCLRGVDKIINLVGANVAEPWTDSHKKAIYDSRIETAALLKKSLRENEHRVNQITSASAIGIYPDSQKNYYHESTSDSADNFLGDVVVKWEKAVDEFSELGLEVAKIRIGLVLSADGGALSPILKTVKNYLGAPLGNGKQWQSWIHIYDLSRMFLFAVNNNLDGVYNGVAPNPVSNEKMTNCIAELEGKPLWLPNVPAIVLKTAMGERSCLVLNSQRVSAEKIESLNFDFRFPILKKALQNLLG